MAATRQDLEQTLARINRWSGREFEFDWLGRRAKVCFKGRELSPRLSYKEMLRWLEAFELGLEYSGANKMKDALGLAPIPPRPLMNEQPSPRTAELLQQWMAEYYDWFEGMRPDSWELNSNNEARMSG